MLSFSSPRPCLVFLPLSEDNELISSDQESLIWFLDPCEVQSKWRKNWSAVQFIKHCCWAASHSAWLPPVSLSLCLSLGCLLTFAPLQSFYLLQAHVAQWGVEGKNGKKEKRNMWTQQADHGGMNKWVGFWLDCVVATPTGREEERVDRGE